MRIGRAQKQYNLHQADLIYCVSLLSFHTRFSHEEKFSETDGGDIYGQKHPWLRFIYV